MSSPLLADTGQPFTVGKAALLLTEYAPVTVINTSTSTVYVAGTSSVGPSNGVPVEAGTALPWKTSGQLWAVLDPAATDSSATVVLTGATDTWSPSPATIAAEVASSALATAIANAIAASTLAAETAAQIQASTLATDTAVSTAQQLLAGGVPNVLTTTDLGTITVPASGAVDIDVSGYASVTIAPTDSPGISVGYSLTYALYAVGHAAIVDSGELSNASNGGSNNVPKPLTVNVTGTILRLQTTDAYAHTVRLIGSNRAIPAPRPQAYGFSTTGKTWEASVTGTGNITLSPGDTLQNPQGPCFAIFYIASSSTTKGQFKVQTRNAAALNTYEVSDTSETGWHVIGTNQTLTKMIALPACDYDLIFTCTTAGGGTARLKVIPAY